MDAFNDCVKVLDTLVLTQSVPMKEYKSIGVYAALHIAIQQQYAVSLRNEAE